MVENFPEGRLSFRKLGLKGRPQNALLADQASGGEKDFSLDRISLVFRVVAGFIGVE